MMCCSVKYTECYVQQIDLRRNEKIYLRKLVEYSIKGNHVAIIKTIIKITL